MAAESHTSSVVTCYCQGRINTVLLSFLKQEMASPGGKINHQFLSSEKRIGQKEVKIIDEQSLNFIFSECG